MTELTASECKRRLPRLREVFEGYGTLPDDFTCQCHEGAKGKAAELLRQTILGDEDAMKNLLAYYERCIAAWSKDLYPSEAQRMMFRAELTRALVRLAPGLGADGFCKAMQLCSTHIAISSYEAIIGADSEVDGKAPRTDHEIELGEVLPEKVHLLWGPDPRENHIDFRTVEDSSPDEHSARCHR